MKNKYEVALEVIRGNWGFVPERYERLTKAGYDPEEIQDIVNNFSVDEIKKLAEAMSSGKISDKNDTLEVKVNLKKYSKILLIFEGE